MANIFKLFGYKVSRIKTDKKKYQKLKPDTGNKKTGKVVVPTGRSSVNNDLMKATTLESLQSSLKIVKPSFMFETIPTIRALYKVNEDVGSVLHDLVQLTNTGHIIKFDQDIKDKEADKMRDHLEEASKKWGYGTAGLNGLINKIINQIWVGGSLSAEIVPNRRLTSVNVSLINPETIRFVVDKDGDYHPYQKVNTLNGVLGEYIKLNPITYKYFSLIGDEDTPYGIPPFLTALGSIVTQKDMKQNINHIMNQMGLLGYLEVKLDKPDQLAGESLSKYRQRLEGLLEESKRNTLGGFKEGVVTGFIDDHDFEFKSTTKNLNGVTDLFNMNENQIANGLKTTASFLGIDSSGNEGQLGIVFTKMLSQLKNVQMILSAFIEHLYYLELTMAGFNPKGIKVVFNTSTITDDLKLWQGKEIKQRVLDKLYLRYIISSEVYAEEMGYKSAYKVVDAKDAIEVGKDSSKTKEDREKGKDKSDRKVRDKDKTQPKRKDTDTRER